MFRSALLALALCAAPAGAQCINIDFGDAFGSPSPTYGAAAGQAGVWQVLAPVLGQDLALVDTAGSATTATVRFDWGPLASSSLGGSDREPTGEHEKLVDDWWSINSNDYSTLFEVQFKGLEPGLYRVYTYSWWDPGKFKKTKVDVLRGGVFGAYSGGGAWSGHHELAGQATETGTYQGDITTSFDGRLRVDLHAVSFPSKVNGMQLVRVGSCPSSQYTTYCTQGPVAGCVPEFFAGGAASSSNAQNFDVALVGGPPQWTGLAYFSINGRTSVPWQGGPTYQCVQPPVQRALLLDAGFATSPCGGYFRFDFNAWMAQNPQVAPPAGSQVGLQLWLQDPGNTAAVAGLSGAVEFTVAP